MNPEELKAYLKKHLRVKTYYDFDDYCLTTQLLLDGEVISSSNYSCYGIEAGMGPCDDEESSLEE